MASSSAAAKDLQVNKYREAFRLFDVEGNGVIATHELKDVLQNLGIEHTPADLEKLMKKLDANGDGVINLSEFEALMTLQRKSSSTSADDDLRRAFRMFDADGSGTINEEELFQCLKKLGFVFTKKQVSDMMQFADVDGNGDINYEEFIKVNKF